MHRADDDARRQPGVKTTHQASIAADCADNIGKNQSIKPEIDLLSWSQLGGNAKPPRCRTKPKWGGI